VTARASKYRVGQITGIGRSTIARDPRRVIRWDHHWPIMGQDDH